MGAFVLSLGLCSAVMSATSLLCFAFCSVLKKVWSAKRRYIMWIVLFIGFLTPAKPHFGEPVYTVSPMSLPQPQVLTESSGLYSGNIIYVVLFSVWLAGFLSCIAYYAYKQYSFIRYASRFSKPCSSSVLHTANALCKELNINNLRVFVLPGVPSPMLTGLFSPTVLLPGESYADEELRLILKHELTHFKQHDLLIKLFALICRSVHWFNPLMPLFAKSLDRMCELSCDERVLQGEGEDEKKIYCNAILSAVWAERLSAFSLKPAVAGSFGNGKTDLRYRLGLIVSSSANKKLGVLCVFLCCLTLFSGAVFGVQYESGFSGGLVETTFTQAYAVEPERSDAREASTVDFEDDIEVSAETWSEVTGYSSKDRRHEELFTDVTDLSEN